MTPLNTVVLANTLFCSLQQLYADLGRGISNYWIHLDQFNKMLLEKKQVEKERTVEDELVFQKRFVNY